jgi:hypothetical protein
MGGVVTNVFWSDIVLRYADDRELNEELKEREMWNDPASQFLSVRILIQGFVLSIVL